MTKKDKKKLEAQGLREVKTAGFTATKKVKRDKTVNRRAGLHDKLKNLHGEARVKRCKPLALKHVRRMRKVAAVASLGVVGAVSVFGVGFLMSTKDIQLDGEFETVCYVAPTDGTKPTDHTLVENVGYMNYVLQNQLFWSSQSHSDVDAVAMGVPAKQWVDNYKQYYNDVLISADCSFSGVSKLLQYGEQFCQTNGVVLSRYSTSNETADLEKGMDAPWSTGPANGWTIKGFKANRGLPPYDFSVYVLNELTIANAYDYTVVDNYNGTYSMSLKLNTNTGVDETSADYYYRLQMQKNGGLNDLPTIYYTTLTYTFDESWHVLKLEVDDSYTLKAVGMKSDCTSHTQTDYYYDEDLAKNTFWEDYFKAEYERQKDTLIDGGVDSEGPVDNAFNYVSMAFGSVLTDGAVFKVDLNIDNLDLNGVVNVEMENGGFSGLTAKLGDILVWLDGNTLYLNDGSAKYKLDINALTAGSEEGGEENGVSAQGLTDGLDLTALMDQMTDGEFVINEETGVATLNSELELFGLKISLAFEFQKTEEGVDLNFLKAEIPLGEKVVKAKLCFGTESDKPAIPQNTLGYQDILNDGVTLDIALSANGLKLEGVAKIIMENGKFAGVCAYLDDIAVYYDCPHNMLYLSKGNIRYKLNISALDSGDASTFALLDTFDINPLISDILANLSTTENSLGSSLGINIDALESVLKAALEIRLFGGLKVDAGLSVENLNVSFSAALSNKTVTLPRLNAYIDVLNSKITFDVSLTLLTGTTDEATGKRDEVTLEGKVALCLVDGAVNEIRADFGELAVYFDFSANSLYLKVGTTKAMLNFSQTDLTGISALSTADGNELIPETLPTAIKQLLTNLVIDGKIISTNAKLSLLDALVPVRAQLDLSEDISIRAGLSLLGIDAEVQVKFSETPLEGLSAEEKEEYTDILKDGWSLVDGLTGEHISASVGGTVYSYTEEYQEQNNIKYGFNATLEYDKGHTVNEDGETVPNAFPIHIEEGTLNAEGKREGANFYIDSTLYLHFNLALEASKPTEDSLFLDLWLFDANPTIDKKENIGKTTADALTQDGELDVYIEISKYKDYDKTYTVYDKDGNVKVDDTNKEITTNKEPLRLYAPVSEIMTLVSMAGAAADLHGLTFKNSAELTKLASDIADIVDQLLISKYLPYNSDQFASLGNSLIPQILGMSLNDLLNKLIGSAEEVADNASSFKLDLSKNYVNGITYGDDSLEVKLNSANLFGENATEDLVVTLTKTTVEDEKYLSSISLENLYSGENNSQKLNLALNLNYREIKHPAQMSGFTSAEGLDTLVKAVVNSATHKVGGADSKSYDLNHYYLLQGSVKANIEAIKIVNVDATINFKSVAVYIDEETNNVSIDAHIYYDGVAAAGQVAIDGDADVYLSMRLGSNQDKGRIVIRRVRYSYYKTGFLSASEQNYATPVVEVRSMTLDEFSANLMDNIIFLFNFGSVITDNIKGSSSGSSLSFDGYDYGKFLSTILAYYDFDKTATGASWTVAINGDMLTSLIGMTMSDIPIKFSAGLNEDGTYTVKKLDILTSTMQLLGNVVTLKVSGSFTYCNPHEEMGDYVDSSDDLFNMDVTVSSDYELPYINSSFNWACGSYVKLPVGVVNSQGYMLDGYTQTTVKENKNKDVAKEYITENVQFEGFVEEDGVRYGLVTLKGDTDYTAIWNKIYTVSFLDENGNELYRQTYHENEILSADNTPVCPEIYGYIGEWEGANGTAVNGNLSFTLKYSPVQFNITLVDGDTSVTRGYDYLSKVNISNLETNTHVLDYLYDENGKQYHDDEDIIVLGDATYYVKMSAKSFSVNYASDVDFSKDGLDTEMNFDDASDYLSAVTSEGLSFLGWFIQNGESYKYVADANALKAFLSESYVVDGSTVTLWAVWYNETVTGEITNATHSGTVLHTWYVKGHVNSPFENKSAEIAQKAGITVKTQIVYYVSKDGDALTKDLNWSSKENVNSDGSFEKTVKNSTVGTGTGNYVGGKVMVTISLQGAESISLEGKLFKHI